MLSVKPLLASAELIAPLALAEGEALAVELGHVADLAVYPHTVLEAHFDRHIAPFS